MADIIIPLGETATTEAVPSKTFEQAYILDLNVRAYTGGPEDTIYINYCPFNKDTGEKLLTDQREIRLPFWETVGAVPEAEDAFAAVAAAIPALIAYQADRNTPVAPPVE